MRFKAWGEGGLWPCRCLGTGLLWARVRLVRLRQFHSVGEGGMVLECGGDTLPWDADRVVGWTADSLLQDWRVGTV
jgi:hypothetical protein